MTRLMGWLIRMQREIVLKSTRRLTLLALMVSLALILSIVESLLPINALIPIYGVKLGLANIITVIVIIFFGYKDALLVVIIRCVLASAFGGGFSVFLFSVTGGILSTIIMAILYKRASKIFSLTGVSIAGAIMHNIGQIFIACFVMKTLSVLTYLPVLLISGIIMGCFIGLCSKYLADALKKTNILGG
jgi:heptaprenyl diphosphate synthase